MQGTATIRFRADPGIFGAVRRYVAQFVILAGGSDEDAEELELATGEVLANAYAHAYRRAHGPVQLDMRCTRQEVEVQIRDEGEGPAGPLSIPSTLPEGNEHRGLYLVGKLTDRVDIVRPADERLGTTIRLVKRVDKPLAAQSKLAPP